MPPSLSVVVICRNEASHIRDCLRSARFADEIVVVDGGSSDGTADLARELADAVYVRPMERGFGEYKNWAMEKTTGDWILVLDADERISAAGRREILAAIAGPGEAVAFSFPRLTRFLGRDIRHSGWYDSAIIRLVRRDGGRHDDAWVHEVIVPSGPCRELREPLIHFTYRDVRHHLDKMQTYTTLNARDFHAAGVRIRRGNLPWYLLLKPAAIFLRKLILMQGWRDGVQGFVIAVMSAAQYFLSYVKLWDLERRGPLPRDLVILHESAGMGGAEQSLALLATHLPEPWRVRFVLGEEGPLAELLRQRGVDVQVQPLASARRPLTFFRDLVRLYRELRRQPPAIIHSNSPRSYLYGGLLARLTGARSLFHVRVMLADEKQDPVHRLRRLADHVVCNSDAIRLRFPGWKQASTVKNGVDLPRFRAAAGRRSAVRAELGISPEALVIGMLNRYDRDKGWEDFFRLVETMDDPQIRFLVAGDAVFADDEGYGATVRDRLDHLAAKGRLQRTGFRQDVENLLAAMDLVVQPSRHEGCSRVLLEAQAMGLPVVAYATGGNPELVVDRVTGRLVAPGDGSAFCKAVRELAEDRSMREAMGRAGLARIRQRFRVEDNVRGLIRIYESILRG